MFGEPYYEPQLHTDIHASPTELAYQFGMMPLPMYVHAAQCVPAPLGGALRHAADRPHFNRRDGAQALQGHRRPVAHGRDEPLCGIAIASIACTNG